MRPEACGSFCQDRSGLDRIVGDFGGRYKRKSKKKKKKKERICVICRRIRPRNMSDKEWKQHLNAPHPFACGRCVVVFASERDRLNHVQRVHVHPEYCSKCRMKRKTVLEDWLVHVNKIHAIPCSHCSLMFAKEHHRRLHALAVHESKPSRNSTLEWVPEEFEMPRCSTAADDAQGAETQAILGQSKIFGGEPLVRQHTETLIDIFENVRELSEIQQEDLARDVSNGLCERPDDIDWCRETIRAARPGDIKMSKQRKLGC